MSERTRCNYCTLTDIIRRHPGAMFKVVTDDWTVVFVDGRWTASFKGLTEECAC